MIKLLASLAALGLTLPASATPVRLVVNPYEPMVTVPGLEALGPSRLSTVEFCSETEGVNWKDLQTDSDYHQMEACLIEHT